MSDLVDQMVAATDGLVRRSIAPLSERIESIEKWRRDVGDAHGPAGAAGKDGAPGREGVDGKDGAPGREGVDGKDGAPGRDGVDGKAGEPGRDGRDGKDGKDGRDGDRGANGEKGAAGKDGKDGVGIDRLVVEQKSVEIILTDGRSAVVELPTGPAGEAGRAGERGEKGDRGATGPAPTADEVEAVVMRHVPNLIVKALDAATPGIVAKAAALVPPGRDGLPGAPGRPGASGEDGSDGRDGEPGRDAFSIDDFDISLEGRTLTLSLTADGLTVQKQVKLPGLPDYKGVYQHGHAHEQGDMVTYGGSMWRAKQDTAQPPKGTSDHWHLVVKGGK